MKPVARRILVFVGVVIGVVVLLLLAGVALLKAEPSYYRPLAMTPEQIESAARRVEDKLVEIRNVAGERRMDQANAAAATRGTVYVVTFTQDELNAFLAKWSELSAVRSALGGQIDRPAVALRKGEVILAARANLGQINSVLGVHLRPTLTADGLRLTLDRVTAGRLPVPRATFDGELSRLTGPLAGRLPEWRREARFDRTGAATQDAIKALYARLLVESLAGRAVDPVVLIPLEGDRGIPVRLTDVETADGSITVQAVPLDANERSAFLRRLKSAD